MKVNRTNDEKHKNLTIMCKRSPLILFLGCMLVDFFIGEGAILMFPYHIYSLATRFSPDDHQQLFTWANL